MATVTPIEASEAADIPQRSTEKKPKSKAGRPKKGTPPSPVAEQRFFDKVKAIPFEDWGQRACIYCYVTEPLCNLRADGGNKYLFRSDAPIPDLQKIMVDYGSFKGYLTLNVRKAAEKHGDMIDRFDFEIYNPLHPPKIPRKAWIDDSRNEKWAALLPPEPIAPAAPQGQPSFVETARLLQEIRRDAREEAEANQPLPPEPIDPVEQFKGVAEVFKTLKGDDKKGDGESVMLKMMELQQKSTEATMVAMRLEMSEARKREHELQLKLIESANKPAQQDEITKKIVDKALDKVLNPEASEAIPVRNRGPWYADIIHDVAVALPNSPVMANLSQAALLWAQASAMSRMGAKTGAVTPAASQPAPPSRPAQTIEQGPGVPEPEPQSQPIGPGMKFTPEQLAPLVGMIAEPMQNLMNSPDCDGTRLAEWMIVQKGQMQYDLVANQGPEILMQAIRLSPFWQSFQLQGYPQHPGFAHFEPQLKTLLEDFCDPPDDEESPDNDEVKPEDILE